MQTAAELFPIAGNRDGRMADGDDRRDAAATGPLAVPALADRS